MSTLTFVSLMAANADAIYQSIADELARRTGLSLHYVSDQPWQARERMLDDGQADIAVLCGAAYVRKLAQPAHAIQLLAVPVMQAARYQDKPVYFSDVIVQADAPMQTFADLRGAAWAYNEPQSYSGYHVVCAHLATLGESAAYFGRVAASGSHQESLRLVIAGEVDAATIDSIVLERAFQLQPELAAQVRVVLALGPSPIPPIVVARRLAPETRRTLRTALLTMHEDADGRRILQDGLLSRFLATNDAAYDDMRHQLQRASAVRLAHPAQPARQE